MCTFISNIIIFFSELPAVQIVDMCKIYKSVKIIDNLTISFEKGTITALLGHNGAGKTTTMLEFWSMYYSESYSVNIAEIIHLMIKLILLIL